MSLSHRVPSVRIASAVAGVIGAVAAGTLAAPAASAAPAGDVAGPRLVVQSHARSDVPRYVEFGYQTGSVTGMPAAAAARADGILGSLVDKPYQAALTAKASRCAAGASECGYFIQRLRSYPCVSAVLCVASQVGLLVPGNNGSVTYVDTRAIDTRTGARLPLSRFVPADRRAGFLAAVNAGIQRQLAAGGITGDPLWATPVGWKSITAWLPRADGLDVWFAKYDVAPGSFGDVHLRVPWRVVR